MVHGWTAEPFNLSSTDGWKAHEVELTPEQKEAIAQINGAGQLFRGVVLNTNTCMSNPKVRQTMVRSIVEYAEASTNVDYLPVWLADANRNHCECAECQKLLPSDY